MVVLAVVVLFVLFVVAVLFMVVLLFMLIVLLLLSFLVLQYCCCVAVASLVVDFFAVCLWLLFIINTLNLSRQRCFSACFACMSSDQVD